MGCWFVGSSVVLFVCVSGIGCSVWSGRCLVGVVSGVGVVVRGLGLGVGGIWSWLWVWAWVWCFVCGVVGG